MEVQASLLWWWWWWCVSGDVLTGLARAQTPCMPKLVLEGASENPQRPWKFASWQRVQLRVTTVPSRECQQSALEYCWQLHHRQGHDAPQPVPCNEVAQCEGEGASLDHAPYTLTRANYTVQVAVRLHDSLLPHRCLTGYFAIPPTITFPWYFHRGPRLALPDQFERTISLEGAKDPDKDQKDVNNVMDLNVLLTCKDPTNVPFCRALNFTPKKTRFRYKTRKTYMTYIYYDDRIPSGRLYKYMATAKEKVWPYRTAEAWQEVGFLKTGPVPEVVVVCPQCTMQRLLPTDTVVMRVQCLAFNCIRNMPIHCTWLVEQEGIGPLDLTIHTKERKASGVDLRNLTILPGAFQPGADIRVKIRVHYAPTTEEQIRAYKKVADEYRTYQRKRP